MSESPLNLRAVIRDIVREEIAAMLGTPQDDITDFVETFVREPEEPTPRKRRPAQNYDLGFARALVEAECIEDPMAETLHRDLYARYLVLCEEHNTPPRTRIGLSKALGHLGYEPIRVGRETGRRGLRLRPR